LRLDSPEKQKDRKKEESSSTDSSEHERRRDDYFSKLAKPKDKWKVGRKLLEL